MLAVNEAYGKVQQGEGKSTGMWCFFLRLSLCNLHCSWCFVPSTKIVMGNNKRKRIDQIKVGDLVMSWNRDHFEPRKVTKVYKSIANEILKVNISNRPTWCTPEHPFLTKHGWVAAKDLQPGDSIVHWDVRTRMKIFNPRQKGDSYNLSEEELKNGAIVKKVSQISGEALSRLYGLYHTPKFVYNLEVEETHTYCANTLVVHNCDTPYTWNWLKTPFEHPDKYDRKKEIHRMQMDFVIEKLEHLSAINNNLKNLVISGGEPLLQWKALLRIIQKLKAKGWWIEVETNGTVLPNPMFLDLIDQINCSPKLENSGDPLSDRIKPQVLRAFTQLKKTTFKFVVSSQIDMEEIVNLVKQYDMKEVYLMPMGRTKDELLYTSIITKDLAHKHGFFYSPRKHIELHGSKRGV